MALPKWANINTLTELEAYVAAELAEAQKCPAALAQYSGAYNYLTSMMSLPSGSQPMDLLNDVKRQVEAARATWKSAGCAAAKAASSGTIEAAQVSPIESGTDAPAASGGFPTWLLGLLGVGVVAYFVMRKK